MYKWIEVGKGLFRRFNDSKISVHAAALAYHTLLAIVPLLGIAFWYLDSIGMTTEWGFQAKTFLLSHLNVAAGDEFLVYFEQLTGNVSGGSWGIIGLVIFIYTGFNLVLRIGDALDEVLQTRTVEFSLRSGVVVKMVRRFIFLGLFPLVLAASLAIMTWIRHGSFLSVVFGIPHVGTWLAWPLPYCMDAFALFLVYWAVPNLRIRWKQAFFAALIVAPIFNLAKFAMGVYSRYALTNQKIYGALAVLPVFVLWVQLAWVIFLCGALIIDAERKAEREAKRDLL
jgi:membrane protein